MTPPGNAVGLAAPLRIADLPRKARGVVVAHETDPGTAERLAALGLGVGAAFTVLQEGLAPRILVGECRLGLGREIACAVRVLPS